MGQEGEDIVSLPAPPPPNPAARRSAIDAAVRKFDGVEEAPRGGTAGRRPGMFGWAASHKRATGGLVTAALIAVVGIPAMQIALRDQPQQAASEQVDPGIATPEAGSVQDNVQSDAPETPASRPPAVPVARSEPAGDSAAATPSAVDEQAGGFTAPDRVQQERASTVAPQVAASAPPVAAAPSAPPPPSPPPPPPMAEREAADAVAAESGKIVVTGQKARRQNMDSPMPVTVVAAEGAYADFQEKLQSAFRTNDRKAILGLVAFPLQVSYDGDVRTYRSRDDVGRDFGRIFTAEVRSSVLSGEASRRIGFAPSCTRQACPSGSSVRIRSVRP